MKTPITRRIENIRRDTYQPQRIGYPVTLASRPKSHWLIRDILFGASALIVISAALGIYHILTK